MSYYIESDLYSYLHSRSRASTYEIIRPSYSEIFYHKLHNEWHNILEYVNKDTGSQVF